MPESPVCIRLPLIKLPAVSYVNSLGINLGLIEEDVFCHKLAPSCGRVVRGVFHRRRGNLL